MLGKSNSKRRELRRNLNEDSRKSTEELLNKRNGGTEECRNRNWLSFPFVIPLRSSVPLVQS